MPAHRIYLVDFCFCGRVGLFNGPNLSTTPKSKSLKVGPCFISYFYLFWLNYLILSKIQEFLIFVLFFKESIATQYFFFKKKKELKLTKKNEIWKNKGLFYLL